MCVCVVVERGGKGGGEGEGEVGMSHKTNMTKASSSS